MGELRRFVTRRCVVCDWRGGHVDAVPTVRACPVCHAPTEIEREELLVPISGAKNPIAAALSALGASKGGAARARRLSAGRRQEIARAAARARWRKR